jgi:tRNA A-37 threonylcarbamoyl transferase component Bud32
MVKTEGSVVQPGPAGTPDVLPPGAKAGPWVVGERLGRGGMGSVYAVTHEEIGKRAALKVMHEFLATGATAERIKLEARVVNRVNHPNIVDIFETGSLADGRPYIVMEKLDGVCLGQLAYESKVLPDRVVELLIQICDALIAAHGAGVIHRDLKLDNVFLVPVEGGVERVKLLDWGIAKEVASDVHCTIDGQLVGTPQYLSPEQARGAVLTPATDVYSLGVMAFELFLEQLPFEAETAAEVMTMHLRAAPPIPHELWPDIPTALEQLLLAMLAKTPEQRPSLETVAGTLLRVRDELDSRRSEPKAAAPARHTRFASAPPLVPVTMQAIGKSRWQLALGALAIVASGILFLIASDSRSQAAPAPVALRASSVTAPVAPAPRPDPAPAMAAPQAPSSLATAPATAARGAMPADAARAKPVAKLQAVAAKRDPAATGSALADGLASTSHRPHHAVGSVSSRQRTAANVDPDGSVESY